MFLCYSYYKLLDSFCCVDGGDDSDEDLMAIVNAAVSAGVVTEGPSTSEVTTGPRRRLTQTQTPPATS